MPLQAIVLVDEGWGIGYQNRLLYHIPNDLQRFYSLTQNHTVVVGRQTLSTFPGGLPLKERRNIILTRDSAAIDGATVLHSLPELAEDIRRHPEACYWVVGGESVYRQLLPYCRRCFVTKVAGSKPADRYFPNLDKAGEWALTEETPPKRYQGLRYTFAVYRNNAVKALV